MRAHDLRFASCLLGIIIMLVEWPAHAQCTTDVECKGDRICVQGVCAAPDAGLAPPEPSASSMLLPTPPPVPPPTAPTPGNSAPVLTAPGPNPADQPNTFAVRFVGADGWTVRYIARTGVTQSCELPCVLMLPAGPAELTLVSGFTETIVVPTHASTFEVTWKRKGLIVAGIVGLVVGGVAASLALEERDRYQTCRKQPQTDPNGCEDGTVFGLAVSGVLFAAGAGLLIPGILSKSGFKLSDDAPQGALSLGSVSWRVGVMDRGGGWLSARVRF